MSIRKKMAFGAAWTFLEKAGQQIMFLVVFAILAHLIGPEEFGLYSVCLAVVMFSTMVIYASVDSIIIHKIESDLELSTLFWATASIGALFSIITFALAGPFAGWMRDARLELILQSLSPLPFLTALAVVPTGLVSSRMDFKLFTIRSLISTFVGGVVGIACALKGGGAYSLVFQQIAGQIMVNIIIWPSIRWVPKFLFSMKALPHVLLPGMKMMGSSMLNYFELNIGRMVIGLYLGAVAVGYYSFVMRLWVVLREVLLQPITNVLFPALALVKEDKQESDKLIAQIIFFAGLFIFPAVSGVMAISPQFVPLFFGASWAPAIPIMQLLLISAVVGPFLLIMRDVMRVKNRIGIYFMLQGALLALTTLATFLLAPMGLATLCLGLIALLPIVIAAHIYVVEKHSGVKLTAKYARIWRSLFASAVMYGVIWLADHFSFHPANAYAHLAFSIAIGAVVYGALCWILEYKEIVALIEKLRGVMRARKNTIQTEDVQVSLDE